jgi:heat-inducible transcriptional repressor
MLTPRQQTIITLIVQGYIESAAPISSEWIARNPALGVSPATVRNEIAELEERDYLRRPHPSAGAMPQDKAYRLYVGSLFDADMDPLEPDADAAVRRQLGGVEEDLDEWTSVAAASLAGLVGNMAIVTIPKAPESHVKHLELVYLRDLLVLLIVVMEQARLRRQLIRLTEPAGPSELEAIASKVKGLVMGLSHHQIEARQMSLSPLEEEVAAAAAVLLREEDRERFRNHYLDGLRNLLDQPEFAEYEMVRSVVGGVEDGSLAQAVLDEAPEGASPRVVIGQENRGDMLWPLSVVIGQYGIPGEAAGAVGAVGPVRMEYTKTIAGVGLMADVMSKLVESVRDR